MKAVLQYRASPGFRELLERMAPDGIDTIVVDETDKARFAEEMCDADVLLHVLEPVSAEVIAAAPRLKLIQKIGVGVNTIDLDAARKHGVAVANMPGTNSQAVAEMALALMFAVLRRVPLLDRATRSGNGWAVDAETFDSVGEISGKTVGLVGYGEIPRRLAPVLKALGARIVYASRTEKPDALGEHRSLNSLLEEADIVSLHIPLTDETSGLIGGDALARMKPGAVLINTARGGLVDEAALAGALTSGKLAAAGLDTFVAEPASASNPLFALDNVVTSPHIAWLTPETLARSLDIAFDNCRRAAAGETLQFQIVP